MLYHFVTTSEGWTLLFRDHVEARALWLRVSRATPSLVALCLMPDHVHVLSRVDAWQPLRRALSDYTQWRNARRGESGRVFAGLGPAERVKEGQKGWRLERYVHLNPCRARLTDSPLTWPWCSYREAVGLCLSAVRERSREPARYHSLSVNDSTVDGHPLPVSARVDLGDPRIALPALRGAVSALTRTPLTLVGQRGETRSLLIHASRALTPASCQDIARFVRVGRSTVYRSPASLSAEVRLVERVAGDPRFGPLAELDTRALDRWLEAKRRKRSRWSGTPWGTGPW